MFQRCASCSAITFPPTSRCRSCLRTELRWERSAGRASVYSWTTVWRPVTPAFDVPYVVAIVDVDEGYQMLTNLVECAVEDVHLRMRVEVSFHPIAGGVTLPYFRPAHQSAG